MRNFYARDFDVELLKKQAQYRLQAIESKFKDGDIKKESSLLTELFKAFKLFFVNIAKPTFQKRLLKLESPPISSDHNLTMRELHGDLNALFSETDNLGNSVVRKFNYAETERQRLKNKIKSISSLLKDYYFSALGRRYKLLYGVDSFNDKSKIDYSKITGTAAEVDTSTGVITLKRTGNLNKSSYVSEISRISGLPSWDSSRGLGGYEGLYYAAHGEARPEGGLWHLKTLADGKTVVDKGASEKELNVVRLEMFDDNPDTFWECEYLVEKITGYRHRGTQEQLSVEEYQKLRQQQMDSVVTIENQEINVVDEYIPMVGKQPAGLNIEFIVKFKEPTTVNWIELNPNNFSKTLYIDVLSILTSEDGENYQELEGFADRAYDLTLTSEANKELTEREVLATLAPDKFKYEGQGLWTFAPRKVRTIKFKIRQRQAYTVPYEVLMAELEQTVTHSTTSSSSGGI